MTNDARIDGYARGLFEVARAEGTLDEVEDELFRFARSYESSEELRGALSDDQIPPAKRQSIVEDLLGGKATPTTVQLISMVVGAGHGRDLPAIVDPTVLGGLVATVGDTVIDGTVRTHLDQLKSRL